MSGGVHATLELMPVKPAGTEDETRVLPGVNMLTMLFIRGKCTIERIPDLFDVFAKVLTDINFDDSRSILQNALKSNLSSKKSSVASSGHSFANQRIRGRYSVEGKSFPKSTFLEECIISHLQFTSLSIIQSSLTKNCMVCLVWKAMLTFSKRYHPTGPNLSYV